MTGDERFLTDEEERAARRVERAIKALPKSIALYFHGDTASVMATDENGYIIEREGHDGIDSAHNIGGISTPRCAAGDF